MSVLEASELTISYGGDPVIDSMDMLIPDGLITALVGPNGCGKSTMLKGLSRLISPTGGSVLLDGAAIHRMPSRDLARRLGILPQAPVAPEGLSVKDLVAQGRYPYQSWFRQWSEEDERATEKALELTGMQALSNRPVDTLSGGQRQRAWIAMALAQDTEVLLLDEPTTYLDLSHQFEILDLLKKLNELENRTVVMVLHDLNSAARYAQNVVAMLDGKVVAAGSPGDVITPAMLRSVFNVEARVMRDPETGVMFCLPCGLCPINKSSAVVAGLTKD